MKLFYFVIFMLIVVNIGVSQAQNSGTTSKNADSTYVVDVIATDYAYGMPTEIPSGWVTFRMKNVGKHEHHAIIEKYPDSLTYGKLSKLVLQSIGQEDKRKMQALNQMVVSDYGGPSIISSDRTAETTVQLEPGNYTFTCWLVAPDGKYHAEKGMRRAFKVTSEKSGATKPEGTIDITLSDYLIDIQSPIEAGEHIFNVNFQDYHNVHLAKLDQNQDFENLITWMTKVQTPSEFTFLGGAEQAPAGMSSTFKATLEPGRYALVTYGRSISGMAEEFTVPSRGNNQAISNNPQNPPILLESGSEKGALPNTLPVGRTPVTMKNTGSKGQQYALYMLKKGTTHKEFRTFFENAFINRSLNPNEVENPAYNVWHKVIGPSQEQEFMFKVYPKSYVLIGPLPPGIPEQSPWDRGVVHTIKGVASK